MFLFENNISTTLIVFLQAHRLVLAQTSQWFHRFFQSQKVATEYHIAFFNYSEQMIQTLVDIMNGKEVVIPVKEKNRLVSLLDKLGVKWEEHAVDLLDRPSSQDLQPENRRENLPNSKSFPLASNEMCPPPSNLQPSQEDTESRIDSEEAAKARDKEDFFAILDTFTETSEEELQRTNHVMFGESGEKSRGYQCLICSVKSNYFTQAKKHHDEHEFESLKPVREKLKKAELDRKNDEQDIAKLEKAIGSTDKKRLLRALRQINENLEKHVEVLDSVEKTKLPRHLSQKCKQYTKNLLATIKKVDQVIAKLGN